MIDPRSENEVILGERLDCIGAQRQSHPIPRVDEDVGMVPLGLCQLPHAIDKFERLPEVSEFDLTMDSLSGKRPSRNRSTELMCRTSRQRGSMAVHGHAVFLPEFHNSPSLERSRYT